MMLSVIIVSRAVLMVTLAVNWSQATMAAVHMTRYLLQVTNQLIFPVLVISMKLFNRVHMNY